MYMDYTDKAFGLLLIYLYYAKCQSVGSANPTLPVEGKTSNINHSIKAVYFKFYSTEQFLPLPYVIFCQ